MISLLEMVRVFWQYAPLPDELKNNGLFSKCFTFFKNFFVIVHILGII